MLIYRFRVTNEEQDGFLREIEIQPNQTFLDFHHVMMESAELLQCERASFFNTDRKYKKDKEISLKPEKRQVRKYDEDMDQVVTEAVAIPLMKNEKLKDYIEDPHQKMIYDFVGRDSFSFHIELFKIFPSDGITSFPRCVKRVGELPKRVEKPPLIAEQPAKPKLVLPKIQLPKIEEVSKLDDIVEDEAELAAIEQDLDQLLVDDSVEAGFDTQVAESEEVEDFGYASEEGHEHGEENLDHIEDYEDIENLDKRLSGFDRDSDDY